MKVEDAIKQRRSTRGYTSKPVKWEDLMTVLDAAKYTPMAGNVFSIRFVITADAKKKAAVSTYSLQQNFIQEAPYVIIVCTELDQTRRLYGELAEEYGSKQAAAAVQNMLLQATELGIASCWIGSFDENAIRSVFRIPTSIRVEAIVTLGYAKHKQETPRKADLVRFTFFEEWGKPAGWKERDPHFWAMRSERYEK